MSQPCRPIAIMHGTFLSFQNDVTSIYSATVVNIERENEGTPVMLHFPISSPIQKAKGKEIEKQANLRLTAFMLSLLLNVEATAWKKWENEGTPVM